MEPLRVGIIGAGSISSAYLGNLPRWSEVRVVAVADLNADRARHAAERHNLLALTPDEALRAEDIDAILNLTIPAAHLEIARKAIANGKHVYTEKPFAVSREGGDDLLREADAKGLRIGSAPDTFLGAGIQTARKVFDEGRIGHPVAIQGFMLCPGHESWHPDPEFYYKKGGGPMLDMGPYYLTAMVNLLGPITRVTGSTRVTFPTRTITSSPKSGQTIDVDVPTHYAGVFDFESGVVGELTTSFDCQHGPLPSLLLHGSEGTMMIPDPNGFGGDVKVRGRGAQDWETVPPGHGYVEESRGLGLRDMAMAIRDGRPHRASGALAHHVLDAMLAVEDASREGRHIALTSGVARPEAMPLDF